MPPEAMAAMPMPPEAYAGGPGAWGDAAAGSFDGISPMGGDPVGGAPAFDGAMAAMDGAQAANMAEGMDAANTAADADAAAGAADAPDNAPTDDVV